MKLFEVKKLEKIAELNEHEKRLFNPEEPLPSGILLVPAAGFVFSTAALFFGYLFGINVVLRIVIEIFKSLVISEFAYALIVGLPLLALVIERVQRWQTERRNRSSGAYRYGLLLTEDAVFLRQRGSNRVLRLTRDEVGEFRISQGPRRNKLLRFTWIHSGKKRDLVLDAPIPYFVDVARIAQILEYWRETGALAETGILQRSLPNDRN